MDKISCAQDSNDADQDPENVQNHICLIFLEDGTPREQDCVCGVKNPHKHKWTFRSQPTDEAETKNPHEHPDHFDDADIFYNKYVDGFHV